MTDVNQGTVSKRIALAVALIASFLTPFMASSVAVALPGLGKQFHADTVTLSWVSTSYLLAAAISMVPIGRIADISGRKRILLLGLAVYAVSTLFSALSTSPGMLIACRALEGMGGAMIAGTGMAILISVFPPQERGRMLGISTASTYTGLSLGPVLGGFLTQQLGWRSIFLATMPLALLAIGLLLFRFPGEWAEARGERFDLGGSVIYGLALLAVMTGFSRLPAALGFCLVAIGILGLAAFVRWEARAQSPVLSVNLFRHNTVFALSNLAALLNYSATFAVTFLLSLYLQYIKALTPQQAGLILLAQPLMQAIFSPLAGHVSDRLEPRAVASAGMALNVVGLASLILLGPGTPLPLIVASLLFLGFGFGLFSAPNVNAVMSSVERRLYGVASGTLGTMRVVGQMLSMGTVMLVFTLYMGQTQITPAYYPQFIGSVRVLFVVYAILCTLGVLASLARGKVRRERAAGEEQGTAAA